MRRLQRIDVVEVAELRPALHPYLTHDAAVTIRAIKRDVESLGGIFGVWSALRLQEEQAQLRARWEAWNWWKKSGQGPQPPYQAYATKPGGSWHEAGRAVDFAVFKVVDGRRVSTLGFEAEPEDHLQLFWDIIRPYGWEPVIAKPTFNLEECWHYEFRGPWKWAYERAGYREAVKAAILDVGNCPDYQETQFIQAQLMRLRVYMGRIDGVWGTKTETGLRALGVSRQDAVEQLKTMEVAA